MYNRIKKSMPTGIMAVGFIISAILMIMSYVNSSGSFSYESFIMTEYLREATAVIFTECTVASILFRIYLRKEQSSSHDSQQK